MAPVICKVCNGKAFKTDEAYTQHARDSKAHHLKEKQALSRPSPSSGESVPSGSAAPSVAQVASRPETPAAAMATVVQKAHPERCASKDAAHIKSGLCPQHPKCLRCGGSFVSHDVLEEHRKKEHPMMFCPPCQRYVYTTDYAKHLETTPAHQAEIKPSPPPRIPCPVCKLVFGDNGSCERHIFAFHPHMCCYTCGFISHEENQLAAHYTTATMHPKCQLCNIGFRDSLAYNDHMDAIHASPDTHSLYEVSVAEVPATTSDLVQHSLRPATLNSADEMEEHHLINHRTSKPSGTLPPTSTACIPCNRHFVDAFAYEQHAAAKHPPDLPISQTMSGRSDGTSATTPVLRTLEGLPASSDLPRRSSTSDAISKLEIPNILRKIATEIPQITPHHSRAASEPPPSAVVRGVQSDVIGEANSGRVSPSIIWTSERSIISQPRSSLFGSERSNDTRPASRHGDNAVSEDGTYSQLSRASTPPVVPASGEGSPWSVVSSPSTKYYSVAPAPPSDPELASRGPPPALTATNAATPVYEATGDSPASESSSGLASPRSPHSLLFALSASIHATRAAAQASQGEDVGERGRSGWHEEGALQSPPSSIAPLSPAVVSASVLEAGRPKDSPAAASRTAFTEREVSPVRASSSSRAGAQSKQREPGPQKKALSWHCRSCLGVPSEPTTTMCGHLFCKSCIVEEIVKNYCCPVCRTVMLVRLDISLN